MQFDKGAAGPVSSLLRATNSDSLHHDHANPQASTSSNNVSGFRQTSSSTSNGTIQDEFGSFASSSSANRITEQPFESSWRPTSDRNRLPEREEFDQTRGSGSDGFEVQSLLNGTGFNEEVDGDWERELLESQRLKHSQDSFLPKDPPLPSSTSFARSQAQRVDSSSHLSGDLSPTSSELLSSLSSLDLSSLEYLKSLLSLPPEQAVQRYLDSQETNYTEDVWGLPKEVKEVFERAKQAEGDGENGREKAVRRLGMLMKHLQLGTSSEREADTSVDLKGKGRANETGLKSSTEKPLNAADLARAEWTKEWAEYPLAASHVRSPPRSYFEKSLPPVSLPPPPKPEEFVASILPYPLPESKIDDRLHPNHDLTDSQGVFSVPSSLSSEAFVVHGYSSSVREEVKYPEGVYHEVPGGGAGRGGNE
ncbi:hypothetical protein JCM5350_001238 [Sporobolomyces pararoseus]